MSSVCNGTAENDPCLGRAFLLNFEVYGQYPETIPDPLGSEVRNSRRYWVRDSGFEMANAVTDPGSQFHFRFFTPPIPPGASDWAAYCPPVLVFRGSQGGAPESYRELAIMLDVNVSNWRSSELPASALRQYLKLIKDIDLDNLHFSHPVYIMGNKPDLAALKQINLFSASGTQTQVFSRLFGLWESRVQFDYSIEATLYYGSNGDYGVNVSQGLGERTAQYDAAMRVGVAAAETAKRDWGGRLMIAGHSLGGGQAAAAAAAAKKAHSDVTIQCRGYDAAGLHENTTMKFNKASRNENPSTRCWSVEDEILTTLQSHSGYVPLLDAVLRWGGAANNRSLRFPEAVNCVVEKPGISSGSLPISGYAAPKGSKLYNLFPIQRQNAIAGQTFANTSALDRLSRTGTTHDFVGRVIHYILTGAEDNGFGEDHSGSYTGAALRITRLKSEGLDLLDVFKISADYHGVDIAGFTYFDELTGGL